MVIDLAYHKQSLKEGWVQSCDHKNTLLRQQLKALSS